MSSFGNLLDKMHSKHVKNPHVKPDLHDIANKERVLFSKLQQKTSSSHIQKNKKSTNNYLKMEQYLRKKLQKLQLTKQNISSLTEDTDTLPTDQSVSNKSILHRLPVYKKTVYFMLGLAFLFFVLLMNVIFFYSKNTNINIKKQDYIQEKKREVSEAIQNPIRKDMPDLLNNATNDAIEDTASDEHILQFKKRLENINNYIQQGEYQVALDEAQITDDLFKKKFINNQSKSVINLRISHHNFFSEIYHRLNKLQEALTHSNLALEHSLGLYGGDHPKTAKQYQLVAFNLDHMGQFNQALEMRHKAIHINFNSDQKLIDQGELVTAMSNLGEEYRSLGHFKKSIEVLEQAIERVESLYGIDAPELVVILNNLGLTYAENNKKIIALSYLQQSLTLADHHYGKDHTLSQNIAKNIARLRGFRS